MRILHIITRLILGGAQENTLLSVLGQMEQGHTVRLCCGPTTGPEGSLVQEAKDAGVDYVEVPSLLRAISSLNEWRALHALRAVIRDYQPDVVHTHSSKAGVLGRWAAWSKRVPCVVHTIHGLPFHPYQNFFVNRIYKIAERFAARRCHKIVGVADAMRDQALAAGIGSPVQYVTVYSGMKMEPFLSPSRPVAAIRHDYGLTPDDIVVGKVARLFELKGHDALFDAFAQLLPTYPRLRLFLVGDGLWRKRLEQKAVALGIADRTVFAGLVPHDRVADAIHAMDMVVHCSLREGLARVLPQALLAGKPTISFDVDGAREVILDGETGRLVSPHDIPGLVKALRGILAHPDAATSMAQKGRALCRTRFDWRLMADRLLTVYEEILPSS